MFAPMETKSSASSRRIASLLQHIAPSTGDQGCLRALPCLAYAAPESNEGVQCVLALVLYAIRLTTRMCSLYVGCFAYTVIR